MWISSYCVACIYHTTVRLFSLLTYEDGNSPAMKHIKHISGVKKLVEGIHIIQNKQQCQTTEYDIQFICCSCEISENERKNMVIKHRKKTSIWQQEIQKRYSTMDPTKKERIISQTQTKLPIFRWYREKNYFTNIMKHINPWMRQRRESYFRSAQKNTNQWMKKLKEIY